MPRNCDVSPWPFSHWRICSYMELYCSAMKYSVSKDTWSDKLLLWWLQMQVCLLNSPLLGLATLQPHMTPIVMWPGQVEQNMVCFSQYCQVYCSVLLKCDCWTLWNRRGCCKLEGYVCLRTSCGNDASLFNLLASLPGPFPWALSCLWIRLFHWSCINEWHHASGRLVG